MKPMKPMEPMAPAEKWWSEDLGTPSSTGSQNDMRYACFPGAHKLLVERNQQLTTYDSGDYDINGVSQSSSHDGSLVFTSNGRTVALDALDKAD